MNEVLSLALSWMYSIMLKLLFVFVGVFCILVWPWVYLRCCRIAETQALKQYAMLFGPALVLLAGYFFYTGQPAEIRSQACGVVQGYQTFMTAGNSHQRKPFERIEILMDDAKYSRYLRIDGGLLKKGAGGRACFEFYDRKLNPHMQDSIVIKWRE